MRSYFFLAATLAGLAIAPAHAELGGHSGSLPTEARSMRATALAARPILAVATSATAYTRHDLSLADGGVATEFADANGQVFAVSWRSPTMPDLSALLGAHRASLDKAQRPQPGMGRAPRQINARDGDCVLVSTGRLRAYQGHAYLASQLPADFDLKDLAQ